MPLSHMNALKPTTPRSASSSSAVEVAGHEAAPEREVDARGALGAARAWRRTRRASTVGGCAFSGMSTTRRGAAGGERRGAGARCPPSRVRPGSLKWTCASTSAGKHVQAARVDLLARRRRARPRAAIAPSSMPTSARDARRRHDRPPRDDQVGSAMARQHERARGRRARPRRPPSATDSAGWWLTPPGSARTASRPGSRPASITASWPAPLRAHDARRPAAAPRRPAARGSAGSQATAAVACSAPSSSATPRAAAIASAASRSAATAAARARVVGVADVEAQPRRGPGSRWRRPARRQLPTVATRPSAAARRRSTASDHSAAAPSASRRSAIGDRARVPGRAVELDARRASARRSPMTTPTGRPRRSSSGPCSMCSSR